MKFRPLHDRVVVKRIDAEEKTAGGIIIPDSAKEKPSQGEITAVGPGGHEEEGRVSAFSPFPHPEEPAQPASRRMRPQTQSSHPSRRPSGSSG